MAKSSEGSTQSAPGTTVTGKYKLSVRGCKEMKDAPSTYYLYPGTALYYEIQIRDTTREAEWSVLRRFSEVRKFWETLRPIAAAVGCELEPFPTHSAVMSGAGYTGNLYETNPKSDFARERIALLKDLLSKLADLRDASGGTLLDLKIARAFFDVDSDRKKKGHTPVSGGLSVSADSDDARASEDLPPEERYGLAPPPDMPEKDDWIGTLTRSTPTTFITVFVVVLAALYAFAGDS